MKKPTAFFRDVSDEKSVVGFTCCVGYMAFRIFLIGQEFIYILQYSWKCVISVVCVKTGKGM